MLGADPMLDEEIRSDLTTIKPRGTPLPWMLLVVTIFIAIGIFSMARSRLNDEKQRTANALKANDEVNARLRAAMNDFAKSELTNAEVETKRAMLERQNQELDEKNKALAGELADLKRRSRR